MEVKMSNKLLLIFAEEIFINKNINLAKFDKQLQIACEMLINKGFKVLVSGEGEQSFDFAKKFTLMFQDENINHTEGKLYDLEKNSLIKNSKCVICFKEEIVQLAESLNIPCIFIDIDEKKHDTEESFDEFIIERLDSGKIVKRVEKLINSVLSIEKENSIDTKEEKNNSIENSSDEFEKYKKLIRKTSIIILTYNNLEYSKFCIESIRKYTKKETYKIIVVDNNSTDGTVEWLKEQNDLKLVLNKENLGFPKGCNQGIEVAENCSDILLLNNDTIVTPNWLKNLTKCLYSSQDIGAVGAVTNSCSNYQVITANYNNINEIIDFAKKNNISNPLKWEERLRLVGFCLLIKNEVVKKVGLLDEIYTPGNFEDDDYSFRIRKVGYRMILCKDTYIYHFGSASFGKDSNKYNNILNINREKFKNKWGFDPYYITEIKKDITELIKNDNDENINILQIGCAGGGTLLDIKNSIPSAQLYGIEFIEQVVTNVSHFANIQIGNLNKLKVFQKNYFHIIFITQLLENEKDIISILEYLENYLKNDGKIYIYVSNNQISWNSKLIETLRINIPKYYFKIITKNQQQILYMKKINKIKLNTIKLTVYKKEDIEKFLRNIY